MNTIKSYQLQAIVTSFVICLSMLFSTQAQAGCSVHDHLCSYHAIGQITTPAIEQQLGENSAQGQFSESGLYVISGWQDNASNQSADLDLEVLLPEKALNEDPRDNQFLLPSYSDTGPYVIRSVGYPADGNPFEGIAGEAPRHVGTDQYDITFMNNTARAIHSEDANGANIIANEPAVRPCERTKNCEFVQIKGNIPSGEYRGAVTNYDYHNLSDPSTPYYILGAYLSPDLEETGVIINKSHTNGAMVGTIEDPDQVSEQYVFDFYNRGFSHAKGANAYDDFTKNFYGKTKYADPYTYTSGIYDITVQNKYRDEWTNAYTTTIGADANLSTTNNGTIARRNNVFIGADVSSTFSEAELKRQADEKKRLEDTVNAKSSGLLDENNKDEEYYIFKYAFAKAGYPNMPISKQKLIDNPELAEELIRMEYFGEQEHDFNQNLSEGLKEGVIQGLSEPINELPYQDLIISTTLDFTPLVGDIKGFVEAETPMDYAFATVGIVPLYGDLAKKSYDASKIIDNATDVISDAKKLENSTDINIIIQDIPKKYQCIGKCKDYADTLEQTLKEEGIPSTRIDLKSSTDYIESDRFGTISTNGTHSAIQVGDTIYDNIHPEGIKYDEWIKDMGGETFTSPPFMNINKTEIK